MKIVLTEKTNFSILFAYKAIAVTLKNRSFFVIPQIKVPERTASGPRSSTGFAFVRYFENFIRMVQASSIKNDSSPSVPK
mgnify:CR=1 FL=1